MPNYDEFLEVPLGSFIESDISPEVDAKFRGLKIIMPSEIVISEKVKLPLIGSFQVNEVVLNKFKSFQYEIVIVVTDTNTYKSYSGNLSKESYRPVLATEVEPEKNHVNVVVQGWFNVNLERQIRDIPLEPGKYEAFAIIGNMKSNVVNYELAK